MRGKIIVIEGGDSSGKEVQSKKLFERLKRDGYAVKFADFPNYGGFFGKVIGRYLQGEFGDVMQTNPYLSSLPFALDRMMFKKKLEKWLREGNIVVCNRYVGSNLAFQTAKLPPSRWLNFLTWVEKMEYEIFEIPRETLVIFLNVLPEVGQKLTYQKEEKIYMKGLGRGDIHERNLRYSQTVNKVYLWLAGKRKNWRMVECMAGRKSLRSVEEIHHEVWRVVKLRLGLS